MKAVRIIIEWIISAAIGGTAALLILLIGGGIVWIVGGALLAFITGAIINAMCQSLNANSPKLYAILAGIVVFVLWFCIYALFDDDVSLELVFVITSLPYILTTYLVLVGNR